MKKILIVGAGEFQTQGIIESKKLGYFTIAMDGNPDAVGKKYADKFIPIDIRDKEKCLDWAKQFKIDGVVSIATEVAVETVAYISEKMNLTGNSFRVVTLSHDKAEYYKKLREIGLSIPITFPYSPENVKKIPTDLIIMKPSKGSGSRGVQRLLKNQIYNVIKSYSKKYIIDDEKVLVQEYIKGKELTVDGFINNETFSLLAVSEEMNDPRYGNTFSSELIFPPVWIDDLTINKIKLACMRICKEFNVKFGPIHLEFKLTDSGNLYIIDFSLRGGGFDVFTKIIKLTSGVDILSLYLKASLGEKVFIPTINEFKPVTLSFIYPETEGYIEKINGMKLEGIHSDYCLFFNYKKGEWIDKPESGKQRIGYYICWGIDFKEVIKIRNKIKARIKIIIKN